LVKVSGGQLVIDVLKAQGVDTIFTLTGGQITSIYEAGRGSGINIFDTRDEQAAGFMADAYARLSLQPAVCLASAGPAFTNLLTPMANAYEAGSPVIFISGSAALALRDGRAFQEMDQLPLARPITKWARQVTETSRIAEYLAKAFHWASSEKPGPVYLDLPEDVLNGQAHPAAGSYLAGRPPQTTVCPDSAQVKKAAQMLLASRRPLLIAGSSVWYGRAWEELTSFVQRTKLPTFTQDMGRGCLPDDHPYCLGWANPYFSGAFSRALNRADLILAAGADLSRLAKISFRAPVIGIDADNKDGFWRGNDSVIMSGSSKHSFLALTGDLRKDFRPKGRAEWLSYLVQAQKQEAKRLRGIKKRSAPIHPFRLCQLIDGYLDPDALVVVDGGDTSFWGRLARRVDHPGIFLDAGPWHTLGVGLPFALAAKLKYPKRQVVLITGDGSLGFSLMEFNSAVRHGLPIVVVVSNDKSWGLIKHRQRMAYGSAGAVAAELGLVRYDRLVEDFGGYGELVCKEEEILAALGRAFASGRPACLNVLTDPKIASPAARGWAGRSRAGKGGE
jgi:acetolactate synthase-1/2/3 large subunit